MRRNWKWSLGLAFSSMRSTLQPVSTSRLSGFRHSMKSLPAASGSGSENRLP